MNILYLVGALLLLVLLGYPYFLLVKANQEKGAMRIIGRVMAGLFTLVLVVLIVLYQTGAVQPPRFMPERPSTRIMRGMSGYVTGMMLEDERVIDEFINSLKTNPELYDKVKARLK